MKTALAHRRVKTHAKTASTPSDALRTSTGTRRTAGGGSAPPSAFGWTLPGDDKPGKSVLPTAPAPIVAAATAEQENQDDDQNDELAVVHGC
jgi:hypothetical protein